MLIRLIRSQPASRPARVPRVSPVPNGCLTATPTRPMSTDTPPLLPPSEPSSTDAPSQEITSNPKRSRFSSRLDMAPADRPGYTRVPEMLAKMREAVESGRVQVALDQYFSIKGVRLPVPVFTPLDYRMLTQLLRSKNVIQDRHRRNLGPDQEAENQYLLAKEVNQLRVLVDDWFRVITGDAKFLEYAEIEVTELIHSAALARHWRVVHDTYKLTHHRQLVLRPELTNEVVRCIMVSADVAELGVFWGRVQWHMISFNIETAHLSLALLLKRCRDPRAARALHRMMLLKPPLNDYTRGQLLAVYAQNHQTDEAMALYDRLVGAKESPPETYAFIASHLAQLGKRHLVRQLFDDRAPMATAKDLLLFSKAARILKDVDLLRQVYIHSQRVKDSKTDVMTLALAHAFRRLDDPTTARDIVARYLSAASRLNDDQIRSVFQFYLTTNDVDLAMRAFEITLVKGRATNLRCYTPLLTLLNNAQELTHANRVYDILSGPSFPASLAFDLQMLRFYVLTNQTERIDRIVNRYTDNPAIRGMVFTTLAYSYAHQGRLEPCLAWVHTLTEHRYPLTLNLLKRVFHFLLTRNEVNQAWDLFTTNVEFPSVDPAIAFTLCLREIAATGNVQALETARTWYNAQVERGSSPSNHQKKPKRKPMPSLSAVLNHPATNAQLAATMTQLGRYDDAVEQLLSCPIPRRPMTNARLPNFDAVGTFAAHREQFSSDQISAITAYWTRCQRPQVLEIWNRVKRAESSVEGVQVDDTDVAATAPPSVPSSDPEGP
ncbi:hypothetical protein IWQ60_003772 [Tieghemiomyces parasiticus]|uniref:Uncharacterized protein n=1 Tax=Tieghemiomyces parasiticus TaxID=78921 RepID=A0A9W8A903_9FUNG|nr:hypothetical protein IWQ60_003772 [Tieghemiomyces parasiticus]